MGGTGIIDQFLETFTRYIDSGFGLLGGEVGYLASTLAAIDVTLAGLFWAWERSCWVRRIDCSNCSNDENGNVARFLAWLISICA